MNKTIRNSLIGLGVGGVLLLVASVPAARMTITTAGYVLDCNGSNMRGVTISASNVTVRNCVFEGWTGRAIVIDSRGAGALVENNTILDQNNTIYDAQGSTGSGPDKDNGEVAAQATIRGNIFYMDTCQTPWHCDTFMSFRGAPAGVIFENNTLYNWTIYQDSTGGYLKGQGLQVECGAKDWIIRNNVFHTYRAVNLGDSGCSSVDGFDFHHNTIVGMLPLPVVSVKAWGIFCGVCSGLKVHDNIFYDLDGEQYHGSMACNNNMVYRTDGGRIWDPKCTADIWAVDPLFVDPVNLDYHLQSNSPARGRASDGGDLGAFPFDPAAPTPIPVTGTASRTPAPTNTRTLTVTPSITRTATITRTPSLVPSQTSTLTPVPPIIVDTLTPSPDPSNLCAFITWPLGLNIRTKPSLYSHSIGYYLQGKYVPIVTTKKVIEPVNGIDYVETWAQVNRSQWFAMQINKTVYANIAPCP